MATMLVALAESIVLTEAADLSVPDLLEILYVLHNFSDFIDIRHKYDEYVLHIYNQPN